MLNLTGKILYSQNFGNRITTAFAVVIAETRHFAYIKYLPQIRTYEDDLKYHGTSIPDISKIDEFKNSTKKELLRCKKHLSEDGTLDYIWSNPDLFKLWNGEPIGFDHLD